MKALHEYAPQELQDLSSRDQETHRKVYRKAIKEAAANLHLPDNVLQLLTEVEENYTRQSKGAAPGSLKFKYARQRNLGFIESYLIARFGEDPRVWPKEFDWAAEEVRLTAWRDRNAAPLDWAPEEVDD